VDGARKKAKRSSVITSVIEPLSCHLTNSKEKAKTLRTLAWATQRTEIDPSTTISRDQIDRMIGAKTERGVSFADFFLNAGLLLLVKWQDSRNAKESKCIPRTQSFYHAAAGGGACGSFQGQVFL
jgi:hypothetical protein